MKTLEMNSGIYFSDLPFKFSLMQYIFNQDIWQTPLGPVGMKVFKFTKLRMPDNSLSTSW